MDTDLTFGAYGVYIWFCFGLTALVLVGNIIFARLRLRSALTRARETGATVDTARRPTVTRHA